MNRRILPLLAFIVATPFVASSALADAPQYREVPLQIEPAQLIKAIVIRSGDETRSVEVRNGKALVPKDVALPWTLGLTRFEQTVYTQADLDRARPLVVRELGRLRGTLRGSGPTRGERFTWLLQRADSDSPQEVEFAAADDGSFEIALAAGTYQGAVIGSKSGTKVRSGIVVKPGQSTDIDGLACEPTIPVSLRVVDAKRGGAVAGARVVWNPPGEKLNSGLHRALYARRWSAVTDRYGMATIASVGPAPLSVRWSVEAKGYAPGQTAQLLVSEPKRLAMPDTRLRPEAAVVVRVQMPSSGEKVFRGAILAIGEQQDPRMRRYTRTARADLKEGETKFTVASYGRKRVWIENASGKTIVYHDFDVTSETTVVDLVPQAVEIHGRVTRKGEPVEGVFVRLDDPDDTSILLAQVRADDYGEYRITTFQTGKLRLYTIGKGGPGLAGAASARVDTGGKTDLRVDLEMDTSGFVVSVVDSRSGAPVRADVGYELLFSGERAHIGRGKTDEKGRFVVSDMASGTGKLSVQAKGYRAREIEIPIRSDVPEMEVRLDPSPPVRGRVLDAHGVPIAGAIVTGGYENELDYQPVFFIWTEENGRFEIESAPEIGMMFYFAAPGHALGMTTLSTEQENVIRLTQPTSGAVTLRPDNAPPTKVYMMMAVPAGRESFIPLRVLEELAHINGMTSYQLYGSALDGTVVLPEFLPPGKFTLYIALRGGNPFIYERVGTITAPTDRNVVLAYKLK